MSHAAFIPIDLYGLAAGGVCLVASLLHEFLGDHGPRSAFINSIAYGTTVYYVGAVAIGFSFFGFLYLSRSYIRKKHQQRKHGLDFSAFKGWTTHKFHETIEKTFEKYNKSVKENEDVPTEILWADISELKALSPKIFPKWKKCAMLAGLTGGLWIARSYSLQLCLVLIHCYTIFATYAYLRNTGILKAITSWQIFDVVRDPKHKDKIKAPLEPFFVTKMFVITSLGMYSCEILAERHGRDFEYSLKHIVEFDSRRLRIEIELYTRINTISYLGTRFEPVIIAREGPYGYAKVYATSPRPHLFEPFVDAIYAAIQRRYTGNNPKSIAILLRHIPFCSVPEIVISHIISFLDIPSGSKPRLEIETQVGCEESEWTPGVREFIHPITRQYMCTNIRHYRPYIPQNKITF